MDRCDFQLERTVEDHKRETLTDNTPVINVSVQHHQANEMNNKRSLTSREKLLQQHCNTRYHIRTGVIATAINFFTGTTIGYFSSTNRKIALNELPFPTQDSDVTWLTNAATCCTLLGPIIFTYSMNHFGRKPTMILLRIPVIVQYVVIYCTTCTWQLIVGISIGYVPSLITPSVLSVYVSEVTSPHLRGSLICLILSMFYAGSILGLTLNWTCSLQRSSLVFIVLCVVYVAFLWLLPESPYYLIRKNRPDQAGLVLERLYGDVGCLEVQRLMDHVQQASSGRFRDILRYWKCIFFLMILYFLKYFCGFIPLVWFFPILLSHGQYQYLSPLSCELLLMTSAFFFTLFTTVLFRYFPRRVLGKVSSGLVVLALAFLTVYFYALDDGWTVFHGVYDLLPFLPLLFGLLSATIGALPLAYVYFRELTPVQYVAYFSLIMDFTAPIFTTGVVFVLNYLRVVYGYWACFLFFGVCTIVGGVLFGLYVPETHRRIIENIQEGL